MADKPYTFRLDPELIAAMRSIALAESRKLADQMRLALKEHIQNHPK